MSVDPDAESFYRANKESDSWLYRESLARASFVDEEALFDPEKKGQILINACAEDLDDSYNNVFDCAVSFCAFEHIFSLVPTLNRIWDALKPGGVFCSQFMPIWPSLGGAPCALSV